MSILLVKIDGYFHQSLLTGKRCSKKQLKQKYLQTKELTYDVKDFPHIFCRLYKFELMPYECNIEVDFVIDTDTNEIYSPSY